MKPKVSEWERLVDEEFEGYYSGDVKKIKAFIQQTLDQQKAELVEIVRGMRSDEPSDNGLMYPVEALHKSYNQALDDIINKLEEV